MDESGSCESRRPTFLQTSRPQLAKSSPIKLLFSHWRDYSHKYPTNKLRIDFVLARELNHLVVAVIHNSIKASGSRYSVAIPSDDRFAARSILQRGWTMKTRHQNGNNTLRDHRVEVSNAKFHSLLIFRVIDPPGTRESGTPVYGTRESGKNRKSADRAPA